MTTPDRAERLQWIYDTQDNRELQQKYDAWAKEYDQDLFSYGYKVPGVGAGLICRYVHPGDGSVLDAGAGTGIFGEIMASLGYKDIVAIDLSLGMLEIARAKGAYRELLQMVMGEHLDFPDDTFAATVAMGVLTTGHARPDSFDELIRVTQPGGHIIFSIRVNVYLEDGFKEKQDSLETANRWRLLEMTEPFQTLPLLDPQSRSHVFVYRVS